VTTTLLQMHLPRLHQFSTQKRLSAMILPHSTFPRPSFSETEGL